MIENTHIEYYLRSLFLGFEQTSMVDFCFCLDAIVDVGQSLEARKPKYPWCRNDLALLSHFLGRLWAGSYATWFAYVFSGMNRCPRFSREQ